MEKRTFRKFYPYLIPALFIIVIHIYFYWTNKGYLIFYGDSFEQMLSFYLGGWEKVHQLDFSFWDWTLGYGADIFTRTYYYLTSPFFWISTLFPKAWIPQLFLILNAVKFYLIWIFSYLWLYKLNKHSFASFISATIMTFSGWTLFFYHYNLFLDAFILYPLILIGIDEYVLTKRYKWLTLSVGVLAFVNFYFMYMFVPFMGLYFWFRELTLNEFKLKKFVGKTFKFIGLTLLGISLSAIVFIPSLSIILQTPRLTDFNLYQLFEHVALKDIFRWISTLYTPPMERFDPSYFISTDLYEGLGWGGGVSIHLGYLSLILFPLYFLITQKKERNAYLFVLSLIIFSSFFTIFYRLYQGSVDVRWFYMYLFMIAYAVSFVLSQIDQEKIVKKQILLSLLANVTVLLTLYFISQSYFLNGDIDKQTELVKLVLYALSCLIIYSGILIYKVHFTWIVVFVLIESSIAFYIPILHNPPIEWMVLENRLDDFNEVSAVDYIKSIDQGFYRIIKDTQMYLNQNEPFVQNYMGISFYSSIFNYETMDYYNRFNETYSIPTTMGRYNSYLLTSVKYFISSTNAHTAPVGFNYLTTINDSDIYINEYYIPLGLIQTQTLNLDYFNSLSYMNQDRLLLDYAVLEDSSNTQFAYRNELIEYAHDVHIDRFYFFKEEGFKDEIIIVENHNSGYVNFRSSINSDYYRDDIYGQNFYAMKYFDSMSSIDGLEILVENADTMELGYNIYIDDNLNWMDEWYQEKKEAFTDINFEGDRISANIEVSQDNAYLVTSIPYNDNWSVKVDGESIDYDKVNGGFIGIEINNGYHEVVFKYWPKNFYMGLILSSISLLIFLILMKKSNQTLKYKKVL